MFIGKLHFCWFASTQLDNKHDVLIWSIVFLLLFEYWNYFHHTITLFEKIYNVYLPI